MPVDRTITIQAEFDANPDTAFSIVTAELAGAWRRGELGRHHRLPMRWRPEPGGLVVQPGTEAVIGQVSVWEPGKRFTIRWHDSTGQAEPAEADVRFEPNGDATNLTIELRNWHPFFDETSETRDLAEIRDAGQPGMLGWFTEWIACPAITAGSPHGIDHWGFDRRARWPEGQWAREVYSGSNQGPHASMARTVLKALRITETDHFLEIGCGAGVSLLRWALRTGCRATGVDHSATMVRLAADNNLDEVASGRLRVVEADAIDLPFDDGEFTAIGMVQAFQTMSDPGAVLRECRRVLRPGGRLASLSGGGPGGLKLTPVEQRRTNQELTALAHEVGFSDVSVERHKYGRMLLAE